MSHEKPSFVFSSDVISDKDYVAWIAEVKQRFGSFQAKAAVRVNQAMLELYWSLGRDLVAMRADSKWGSGFFQKLSLDLKAMFPGTTGFSVTNLKYMKRWYQFYSELVMNRQQPADDWPRERVLIRQQPADELVFPEEFGCIPWFHHVIICTKCETLEQALFYVEQTIANNWSREMLEHQLATNLFKRQGAAITNFASTLQEPQSQLAQQMLKEPYNFEFLTLKHDYDERELEDALVANVTRFLLELGKGFAYVGRQMELRIDDETTFFPDLVFYHIPLKCYVVIELKATQYIPEFAGKLNFYVTAADKLLKGQTDNPSVGLVICKTANDTVVEWSLQGVSTPLGVATYQLRQVVDRTVAEIEQRKSKKLTDDGK